MKYSCEVKTCIEGLVLPSKGGRADKGLHFPHWQFDVESLLILVVRAVLKTNYFCYKTSFLLVTNCMQIYTIMVFKQLSKREKAKMITISKIENATVTSKV